MENFQLNHTVIHQCINVDRPLFSLVNYAIGWVKEEDRVQFIMDSMNVSKELAEHWEYKVSAYFGPTWIVGHCAN